ncbi:hypothetical protein PUNSTDRAFT_59787, partial [Punctularia strigosozonata HHB-11173 SS5]|uniref:uncharacterized protein n=1 Tax=Punctularia strigosozonata (strain HHB-11173) TaxID=741275 RepID=UPI0004418617
MEEDKHEDNGSSDLAFAQDNDQEDEEEFNPITAYESLKEAFENIAREAGGSSFICISQQLLIRSRAGTQLDDKDLATLRLFALKVQTHMKADTFAKLPYAFPTQDVPSWKTTQSRAAVLSALDPVMYDCCKNSCCCFVGPHSTLRECPYCKEPRYNATGRPRSQFPYLPLTPRLKAYLESQDMARKMQYRARDHSHIPGTMTDIFDGDLYQQLLRTSVSLHGRNLNHTFFSDPRDVALGLSTDGFAPHKRRKKT